MQETQPKNNSSKSVNPFKVNDWVILVNGSDSTPYKVVAIDEDRCQLEIANGMNFWQIHSALKLSPDKTGKTTQPQPKKEPKKTESSPQSSAAEVVYESKAPKTDASAKFLIFVVLGTLTVLSQQVWLGYGDTIIGSIDRVPFLNLLTQVPFVRGVISLLGQVFPDLFGVGLWLLINCSQSGKDLIKLLGIRHPWWVHQLTEWSKPQYVAIAYIVEFLLNSERFPIYEGGLGQLWQDVSMPDVDSILWMNIPLMVLSLMCFEWTVKFFTIKVVAPKTNGKYRQA